MALNRNQPKRQRVTYESVFGQRYGPAEESSEHENESEKTKKIQTMMKTLQHGLKMAQNDKEALKATMEFERESFKATIDKLISEKTAKRAIYQMERSEEAASTLQLMKDEHNSVTNKLRDVVEELRSQNTQLADSLYNASKVEKTALKEKEVVQIEMSERIAQLKGDLQLLKDNITGRDTSHKSLIRELCELLAQLKEAEDKIKATSEAQLDTATLKIMEEQVQRQGRYLLQVELENKKLHREIDHYKSTHRSTDKLQEQIYGLEQQLSDAQRLRETNIKLERENIELKTERNEWAQYLELHNGLDTETPRTIVAKLTREREVALAKEGEVERLGMELQKQSQQVSEMEATIRELRTTILENGKIHNADVAALELMTKDRDMVKKHVKYLEDQLEFYNVVESNFMEGYDEQKTQRVAALEGLLKEFQDVNATQTQEIMDLRASLNEQSQIHDETEDVIDSGETNGKKQRVLTLKDNAVSREFGIRKKQLDDLRTENTLLLKHLENLQNPESPEHAISEDLMLTVPKQTLENLKSESRLLEELLAKRDKRIVRLTKVNISPSKDGMTYSE
ncbi:coiled-coil domain-containing protein mad1 [Apophysomyces sp. BC1021]|nr:coiled-coil domain-containing protein mad1 [Apophysomyces sp. BC1021]